MTTGYDLDREIAAIGVCMKAIADLELSEALRVVGYVCHFLEMHKLKDAAYQEARYAREAEQRADLAKADQP
jgi:hypothetical protein